MNTRRLAILLVMALLALGFSLPAAGQGGQIIVNSADEVWERPVSGSSTLRGLLDSAKTHIIVEYANVLRYLLVARVPGDLETLLCQVSARHIVAYANANRQVTLAYPAELIGDTTPPQITFIVAEPLTTGVVRVTWRTNEFSTSRVEYGTSPGHYPLAVSDPLYVKTHEITITDLNPVAVYYYRVCSADLAGNEATSSERAFVQVTVTPTPSPTRTPTPTATPTITPTPVPPMHAPLILK